jgi:hypothetical protein
MPNRIIRDGILTSKPVNELSEGAELFYRRLMSVVDDFGRFHADLTILRTQVYPLKPDAYPETTVAAFLTECQRVELIRVYESGRTKVLEMLNFRQRTRAQVSKFPSSDGAARADVGHVTVTGRTEYPQPIDTRLDGQSTVNCPSRDSQVRTETETETETETNAETWDAESAFDELWNAYPAKGRVKRPMSQQYFLDKIRSAKAFTVILAAVKGKWAKSEKWAKGFVMALPSFIDQESWLEDPEPAGGTQTVFSGSGVSQVGTTKGDCRRYGGFRGVVAGIGC